MKRSYLQATWALAALATAGGLLLPACSSKFSSCRATRTCVEPVGGSAGDSDSAGANDQAGGEGEVASSGGSTSGGSTSGGSSGLNAGESAGGEAGTSGADDSSAAGTAGASEQPPSGPVDTVAPTILSITPTNGATKLTPETSIIVITFSEPMNKASAEAAFVPSGNAPTPTFTWNAGATELTINPHLTYPSATDPAASAVPFKFSVSKAATDLAGNSLPAELSWQFAMLREVTQIFTVGRYGTWLNGTGASVPPTNVGDEQNNGEVRGFLGAVIEPLPAGVEVFRSAMLNTSLGEIVGDPFGAFGNLLIQSVTIPSPYHANQAAFDAPALYDLGTFVSANGHNASGDKVAKDVLAALKDDYKNRSARGNQSIYRLLFSSAPNSNSTAELVRVAPTNTGNTLTVTYLYP